MSIEGKIQKDTNYNNDNSNNWLATDIEDQSFNPMHVHEGINSPSVTINSPTACPQKKKNNVAPNT